MRLCVCEKRRGRGTRNRRSSDRSLILPSPVDSASRAPIASLSLFPSASLFRSFLSLLSSTSSSAPTPALDLCVCVLAPREADEATMTEPFLPLESTVSPLISPHHPCVCVCVAVSEGERFFSISPSFAHSSLLLPQQPPPPSLLLLLLPQTMTEGERQRMPLMSRRDPRYL